MFLPRALAKRQRVDGPAPVKPRPEEGSKSIKSSTRSAPDASSSDLRPSLSEPKPRKDSPRGQQLSDDDILTLLDLSLSEYSVWSDQNLLRALKRNEGYISLQKHLVSSPYFSQHITGFESPPGASSIAKALRSANSSTHDFEIRLAIEMPGDDWSNVPLMASTLVALPSNHGGFDIRRKDIRVGDLEGISKDDWENRTIYVENLGSFKTIASVARLVSDLVNIATSETSDELEPSPRSFGLVQHVVFDDRSSGVDQSGHSSSRRDKAVHHRGYAFITLRSADDVERLAKEWPWDVGAHQHPTGKVNDSTQVIEMRKVGFRVISKKRWVALKEEYLAYRQRLIEQTATHSHSERIPRLPPAPTATTTTRGNLHSTRNEYYSPTASPMDENLTYPRGCLVFITNVHPETNKTAIKSILSKAFVGMTLKRANGQDASEANAEKALKCVHYVDYKKGLDQCHIRLLHPSLAPVLVKHFEKNKMYQVTALDEEGATAKSDDKNGAVIKPIEVRVVGGKQEEMYWEKVPEKTTRECIQMARLEVGDVLEGGGGMNVSAAGKKRGRK